MKNNLVHLLFFITAILIGSCRPSGTLEGQAKIVERKMTANGKLMLSYIFKVNGQIVTDSAEVENTVIPADTLKVVYPASNPSESTVYLP